MNTVKIKALHSVNNNRGFFGFKTKYPKNLNPNIVPPQEYEDIIRNINTASTTTYPRGSLLTVFVFIAAIILIIAGFSLSYKFTLLYVVGFILLGLSFITMIVIQVQFKRRLTLRLKQVIGDTNNRLQHRRITFRICEKDQHHHGSHKKKKHMKIYLEMDFPLVLEPTVVYQVQPQHPGLVYPPMVGQPGLAYPPQANVYPVQYQPMEYQPQPGYVYPPPNNGYQPPQTSAYSEQQQQQQNGELPYAPYQPQTPPPVLPKNNTEY